MKNFNKLLVRLLELKKLFRAQGWGSINTWNAVVSEGLKRVRHQLESSLLFFFSKIWKNPDAERSSNSPQVSKSSQRCSNSSKPSTLTTPGWSIETGSQSWWCGWRTSRGVAASCSPGCRRLAGTRGPSLTGPESAGCRATCSCRSLHPGTRCRVSWRNTAPRSTFSVCSLGLSVRWTRRGSLCMNQANEHQPSSSNGSFS